MPSSVGLVLAFIAYLLSSAFIAKSMFTDAKSNYKLVFSTAMAGIIFQLTSVSFILYSGDKLHFSLAAMSLLVNVLIVSVLTLRSLKFANLMILLVTYIFSALLSLGMLFIPGDSFAYVGSASDSSLPLFIHII